MSLFDNLTRFQKNKLIIIGAAFVFNLISVIFSFQLSLNNLRLLVDFSKFIPYMRYIALLGMILFFGVIIMHYLELKPLKKSVEKKDLEIHLLKSRLYDLEENEKKRINDQPQANQSVK
jgi:hypothetical protein